MSTRSNVQLSDFILLLFEKSFWLILEIFDFACGSISFISTMDLNLLTFHFITRQNQLIVKDLISMNLRNLSPRG